MNDYHNNFSGYSLALMDGTNALGLQHVDISPSAVQAISASSSPLRQCAILAGTIPNYIAIYYDAGLNPSYEFDMRLILQKVLEHFGILNNEDDNSSLSLSHIFCVAHYNEKMPIALGFFVDNAPRINNETVAGQFHSITTSTLATNLFISDNWDCLRNVAYALPGGLGLNSTKIEILRYPIFNN